MLFVLGEIQSLLPTTMIICCNWKASETKKTSLTIWLNLLVTVLSYFMYMKEELKALLVDTLMMAMTESCLIIGHLEAVPHLWNLLNFQRKGKEKKKEKKKENKNRKRKIGKEKRKGNKEKKKERKIDPKPGRFSSV